MPLENNLKQLPELDYDSLESKTERVLEICNSVIDIANSMDHMVFVGQGYVHEMTEKFKSIYDAYGEPVMREVRDILDSSEISHVSEVQVIRHTYEEALVQILLSLMVHNTKTSAEKDEFDTFDTATGKFQTFRRVARDPVYKDYPEITTYLRMCAPSRLVYDGRIQKFLSTGKIQYTFENYHLDYSLSRDKNSRFLNIQSSAMLDILIPLIPEAERVVNEAEALISEGEVSSEEQMAEALDAEAYDLIETIENELDESQREIFREEAEEVVRATQRTLKQKVKKFTTRFLRTVKHISVMGVVTYLGVLGFHALIKKSTFSSLKEKTELVDGPTAIEWNDETKIGLDNMAERYVGVYRDSVPQSTDDSIPKIEDKVLHDRFISIISEYAPDVQLRTYTSKEDYEGPSYLQKLVEGREHYGAYYGSGTIYCADTSIQNFFSELAHHLNRDSDLRRRSKGAFDVLTHLGHQTSLYGNFNSLEHQAHQVSEEAIQIFMYARPDDWNVSFADVYNMFRDYYLLVDEEGLEYEISGFRSLTSSLRIACEKDGVSHTLERKEIMKNLFLFGREELRSFIDVWPNDVLKRVFGLVCTEIAKPSCTKESLTYLFESENQLMHMEGHLFSSFSHSYKELETSFDDYIGFSRHSIYEQMQLLESIVSKYHHLHAISPENKENIEMYARDRYELLTRLLLKEHISDSGIQDSTLYEITKEIQKTLSKLKSSSTESFKLFEKKLDILKEYSFVLSVQSEREYGYFGHNLDSAIQYLKSEGDEFSNLILDKIISKLDPEKRY